MKKTLLLCTLCFSFFLNAQVIIDDNVSSLAVGNVGTDLTGATAGQGGWLTFVAMGGSNTDFQVVDAGPGHDNVFQITGSNTAANSRRMFKDVAGDWGFREAGNDVAEIEVDFFTGPATTSANSMRILMYDTTLTKMLGGIMINMSTLVMSGLSYYDNTAVAGGVLGNYAFKLGYTDTPTPAYSDITLQRNTWYKVGASYNYVTGEVIFKESTGLITSPSIVGASAGTDVTQANLIMTAISTTGQANTVSATGLYDNILFKASAASSPLAVKSNVISSFGLALFPNPATNFITISNANAAINKVAIADLNGRIITQDNLDNLASVQMNISDLSSGIYLMTITSDGKSETRKFIKN